MMQRPSFLGVAVLISLVARALVSGVADPEAEHASAQEAQLAYEDAVMQARNASKHQQCFKINVLGVASDDGSVGQHFQFHREAAVMADNASDVFYVTNWRTRERAQVEVRATSGFNGDSYLNAYGWYSGNPINPMPGQFQVGDVLDSCEDCYNVTVSSNDHATGAAGEFFNFNREELSLADGETRRLYVTHSRTGVRAEVSVTGTPSGSTGTAYGQYSGRTVSPAADQFEVGDVLRTCPDRVSQQQLDGVLHELNRYKASMTSLENEYTALRGSVKEAQQTTLNSAQRVAALHGSLVALDHAGRQTTERLSKLMHSTADISAKAKLTNTSANETFPRIHDLLNATGELVEQVDEIGGGDLPQYLESLDRKIWEATDPLSNTSSYAVEMLLNDTDDDVQDLHSEVEGGVVNQLEKHFPHGLNATVLAMHRLGEAVSEDQHDDWPRRQSRMRKLLNRIEPVPMPDSII